MDPRTVHYRVSPAQAGMRLDAFLQAALARELALPELSRAKARRLLMAQAVRLDGQTCRHASLVLRAGQGLDVRLDPERLLAEKPNADIAFELDAGRILYEDEWLIAVDKPAGLPTEATIVASRDHLQAAVQRYLARRDGCRNTPYVGIPHRLDRETSGVIVFAKSREANPGLHAAFAGRQAQKSYLALTASAGAVSAAGQGPGRRSRSPAWAAGQAFRVENHLGRVSAKSAPAQFGPVPQGDLAITECQILAAAPPCYLVQARPLTGRSHQIRVHLGGQGLPLLGDRLYGGPERIAGQAVGRVMLHAQSLSLPHPLKGSPLLIRAELPPDFASLLAACGLEAPD